LYYLCTKAYKRRASPVLDSGAIVGSEAALHVQIGHYKGAQEPSVSTEIAQLRSLLLNGLESAPSTSFTSAASPTDYFSLAIKGEIPLVIEVDKADTIASLILLKREIEKKAESRYDMKWIL